MQYPVTTIPLQYILCNFLIVRYNRPRSSKGYHVFSLKIYSSTPNGFVTRSGIERENISIRDKVKHTFTNTHELHNKESMEGIFEGTGIVELDLDQDPQAELKKIWGNLMRQILRHLTHEHKVKMMKRPPL